MLGQQSERTYASLSAAIEAVAAFKLAVALVGFHTGQEDQDGLPKKFVPAVRRYLRVAGQLSERAVSDVMSQVQLVEIGSETHALGHTHFVFPALDGFSIGSGESGYRIIAIPFEQLHRHQVLGTAQKTDSPMSQLVS